MKKQKSDLLDILKGFSEREEQVRSIFGECNLFNTEISDLYDFVMNYYSIDIENELVFSKIIDFTCGDISKKQLLAVFKKHQK